MTYLRWALGGGIASIVISVVWTVQDVNYYAGVILGLVAIVGSMVLVAKKVR